MPNYVHHQLTITGPETERERFMAECFSKTDDETDFDFDKLDRTARTHQGQIK